MSLKSTVKISRSDAENKLREHYFYLMGRVSEMSNSELEDLVTNAHDARCGGEGFLNFRISSGE